MIRPSKTDAMLEIVRAEPGVTTKQVAERVFVSPKTASNLLAALGNQGLIVSVRSKNSAVWATPEAAEPMRAAIRAASKVRKSAVERASRQRWIEPEDEIDGHPPVQRTVAAWAPMREAPGPISVFHLGAR